MYAEMAAILVSPKDALRGSKHIVGRRCRASTMNFISAAGVIGYMTFLGVGVDCVSIITIIMSIGFAVDLSAHISYAYVKSDASTGQGKAIEALETLGWPVFQVRDTPLYFSPFYPALSFSPHSMKLFLTLPIQPIHSSTPFLGISS